MANRWTSSRTRCTRNNASLVRGSHGRIPDRPEQGPLFITNAPELLDAERHRDSVAATDVKALLLEHLFA